MTPDFVTLMAASSVTRSHAHSALPDAPRISDFVAKIEREPRISTLRKRLAAVIWPGELTYPVSEPAIPVPVPSC